MTPTQNMPPGSEPESTTVDAPNVREQDTTTDTASARTRSDDYAEACLLRALMWARYADVVTLCDGQSATALFSPARRLILRVLMDTARDAVEHGAGQRPVSPAAVAARLERVSGAEAVTALTVDLPEVMAGGTVCGSLASTPSVYEVPLLWESVRRARVYRGMDVAGSMLSTAAAQRDPAEVSRALHVAGVLLRDAEREGMSPAADQTGVKRGGDTA